MNPARRSPATARARMTGEQRREQLIAIGRRLFAEKGFEGTTVEEIAAEGRRLQAGGLRALRRQGGPVRGRRGPRDRCPPRLHHGRPRRRRRHPRDRSSGPPWPCSTTSRARPTASASWCATARPGSRPGRSRA